MAKQQDISNATKEMQDFNKESTTLVVTLQDLAKALKENASAASRFTGDSAGAYSAMFKDSLNLAKEMEGYTVGQLKNRQSEESFLRKVSKLEQDKARVQSRIGYLQDKMVTSTGKELEYVKNSLKVLNNIEDTLEQQVAHADELKKTFEKISKEVKVFDDLSDFFKEIPGVSKVFGEFQKAADAARAAAAEGGNAFKAGAKELSGVFLKGAAAFAMTTAIQGIRNADERIVSLGRNLNKSREESEGLVKNFNRAARGLQGLTGTELQKAAEGFSEALGTTAVVSNATAATLATQVKFMGMSTDEANKLNMLTEATGGDLTKQTKDIIGQTTVSNARNKTGIKYQAVMKDVANASNATKLLIQGQGKNLASAAIEAKKLGTTMEGVAKIGASMLDFESSIGSELEAELLTGGEINNEKARALALMGDTEGLAKEVAKSGVLAKFEGSKNVLQQEALAKAYGMSKEEMADMVVESKALTAMGAKDKSDLSTKVALQLKQIDGIKDLATREKAKADLIAKLGSDEIVRQQENLSLADKQAMANDKIVEAMDALIPIIKPIGKIFEFIANHAQTLAKILLVIAGGAMLSKIGKLVGMFGKLGGGMSNAASVAESVASKIGGGGKSLAGAAAKAATGGATAASTAGGAAKAAKALSPKQLAAGFGGKAAMQGGAEAAAGGGGFLSKIGGGLKDLAKGGKGLLGKMNPMNAIKAAGGPGKLFGKVLKGSMLNTLLTGFFAYNDIKDLIQNPVDENDKPLSTNQLNAKVGKITAGGLGGIIGGILGTAVGGPIGSMVGSFGGQWLMEKIMENSPDAAASLGSLITPLSIWNDDKEQKPKVALASGGITSGPTNALIGEAGQEAVIPLTAFYAKIDELITAVKQGGNIHIGANKLNEAIGINLHTMR